ncbi:MAG: copper amine oxidase N-terminal domain-containing protein [Clostridiales bacterium]|jgi:hypothetical protein|nr:copper amine oxidase N-terminal domain-containing protein [Clostridiales bacterium]
MKHFYLFLSLFVFALFIMAAPVYVDTKRGDPTYLSSYSGQGVYNYEFQGRATAVSPEQILLLINGKFLDSWFSYQFGGESYIPVRAIDKLPGVYVSWEEDDRLATITSNNSEITIYPEKNNAIVNNVETLLSHPPILWGGHIYVTHSFVKTYFAFKTGYLNASGENTFGIAKNPVIYIDSYDASGIIENIRGYTTDSVKETLRASYDSFRLLNQGKPLGQEIGALDNFIKEKIEGAEFIGMIGRYAVFRWPGIILFDVDSHNIFVYQEGGQVSSIRKYKKEAPDIFFHEYFILSGA